MPVYEYECGKCGDRIEAIQKFSDAPLKKHDGCGGRLKKLLSASSFHLKGTGWYVTDYARKGASGDGKDGKPAKDAKEIRDAKEAKDAKETKDAKERKESGAEAKAAKKDDASSTSKETSTKK